MVLPKPYPHRFARVVARVITAFVGASAMMLAASGAEPAPVSDSRHEGWFDLNRNGACDPYEDPARPVEVRIRDLLARMTIEEKLGQMAQYSSARDATGPIVTEAGAEEIRAGRVGSFLNAHGAELTRKMQRIAVEESRLGIPLLFAHDVIHGFRTTFPVPLAEASSWNLDAAERSARIAAIEASAHGLHWTFAPMVDIARDPRWGRVVEGSGEDPYLGSLLAAARVRGFQGDDLGATDRLLACAKHFVAYGGAEAGRDYNTVDISERTLWETYLPPFHAAVDAGVATLMPAFNEIAGVPCHANRGLLRDVLREAWGFDGVVVSDWDAIGEMVAHGVAATDVDAGLLALRAGVDIDMSSGIFGRDFVGLAATGGVDESLVDAAVRNILHAKFARGLFDDPYRFCDEAREQAATLAPEHRAAARAVARESIVLLKNENRTLPLSKTLRSIALIGPLADDRAATLGPWAAAGRPEDAISVLEGIRQALGPDVVIRHARGCEVEGGSLAGFGEADRLAREADAVILVLGETAGMSGEAHSRTSLDLPGHQQSLAEMVHTAAGDKPVVTVLMNGRPLSVGWLAKHTPALVESWFLGVEMGRAVADVLFGDANPCGKLPITFPRTVGQVPIYYNHKSTGRPPDPADRYTSRYLDVHWSPLFPFGHGLSYTTYEYRNLELSTPQIPVDGELTIDVDIANTGDRAGTDVVQLYIQDEVGTTTRPVKELRGFARVELQPGEVRTVTFTLGPDDLACYGPAMAWSVEPGFFKVFVGTSSEQVLEARFEVQAGKQAVPADEGG